MSEIWKSIEGYDGRYEVSSNGKVRAVAHNIKVNDNGRLYFKTVRSKLMKQSPHSAGYLVVNLTMNGKGTLHYVHRLVAEAFIPNPNGYDCINHKDENKANNDVSNLEWCDKQYNNTYGTVRERQRNTLLKTLAERRNTRGEH